MAGCRFRRYRCGRRDGRTVWSAVRRRVRPLAGAAGLVETCPLKRAVGFAWVLSVLVSYYMLGKYLNERKV